jgi:hypothetical protein
VRGWVQLVTSSAAESDYPRTRIYFACSLAPRREMTASFHAKSYPALFPLWSCVFILQFISAVLLAKPWR